jgi:hypothetical protein
MEQIPLIKLKDPNKVETTELLGLVLLGYGLGGLALANSEALAN